MVAEDGDAGRAAIGNRLAAELYGCRVLREGIEDRPGNVTRFVWLAPPRRRGGRRAGRRGRGASRPRSSSGAAATRRPGWLVRCLSELASRGVNLTRIESRPRRMGLGHYMFFVDLEGRADDPAVADALAGLGAHCEGLRVLGTYPAAP